MIETRPLRLSDQSAIDSLREKYGHETSSHAFASLFVWQKDMGLTLTLEEELFSVRCLWRGENDWFFPCGEEEAVCAFVRRALERPRLRFSYMREEDKALLERRFPGKFRFEEKPEDGEYLYDRAEQATFQGGRFARQRGDIHRLFRDHALEWREVTPELLPVARDVCLEWGRANLRPSANGLCVDFAGELLLDQWDALHATGVIGYVDGVPRSLAAGYPLSARTFDQSVSRQSVRLTGLSAATLQALSRMLPEQYTILNGEEDLGNEGLKRLKLRMRPFSVITMYEGECVDG